MLILTHIGQDLPSHINSFLTQIRKFNKNYDVVFLVNQINCNNEIFKNHNIKTYPIEGLINDRINKFIINLGYGGTYSITGHVEYGSADYWCVTAARLFFIYEYCFKNNVKKFFHFENDVMLYEDLDKINEVINNNNLFSNQISITRGTNNKIMTGFMYVDSLEIFDDLLTQISYYLESGQNLYLFGIDHLNEMALLHIYQKLNPYKLVNLPIFPNENLNDNLSKFESVFDPSTYGQYLDGIPSKPGESMLPESLIGSEIRANPETKIVFNQIDNYKIPFIIFNGVSFKINSLHIHSKRLELFLS